MSMRRKRIMYFLFSFVSLCMLIFLLKMVDNNTFLGLPIINEDDLLGYTETTEFDISHMKYNGENIAVDFPSNSVFISQSVENIKNIDSLAGGVSTNQNHSLAVLKSPCLENLSETAKEGKPIVLIILSEKEKMYKKVNLIITNLPILYLDFESNSEDDQGRNLNIGKMTLWTGDAASSGYKTVTGNAEWRLRGNSTRSFDKKAWKLNLRDESFQNKNMNLLGLGSDDDWILNPMSMDDTFIKEKLIQNLWEQVVSDTKYNYKMSKGEYIELFINGAYQGLYLLQRRIDMKYLELDQRQDILLKGINTWEAENMNEGYEIVSTPLNEEDTYSELESAMTFDNKNRINIDNFIDVSLMLQFISGYDNSGYKNMFYILKKTDDRYNLYLVPWDTDLSFGVTWGYAYENSLNAIIQRQETKAVRENVEDYDFRTVKRWKELRGNILKEENIFRICDSLLEKLESCGAVQRDQKIWGKLHKEKDNYENLKKFIQERLSLLDAYYL